LRLLRSANKRLLQVVASHGGLSLHL
ncbi:eamA-like transporter family protein, partial [Vibrio parahaemolyticus V-223/04]